MTPKQTTHAKVLLLTALLLKIQAKDCECLNGAYLETNIRQLKEQTK